MFTVQYLIHIHIVAYKNLRTIYSTIQFIFTVIRNDLEIYKFWNNYSLKVNILSIYMI